jgi:hypothetical protein
MEEQSRLPKPGDLFIGVIDFFAILVPGVAAVMVVARPLIPEMPETVFWVTLLVVGFVLGHVLHGLGGFLDPFLYDPLFKPQDFVDDKSAKPFLNGKYFRANDELYRLAKQLTGYIASSDSIHTELSGTTRDIKQNDPQIKSPPGGMYQWARAWLRFHSPEATAELDRLEADSKLFRSLAVLALPLWVRWNAIPHFVGELPLTVAGFFFSLWRYCDLRQKMVRACYLHYVQLRSTPASQAMTQSAR